MPIGSFLRRSADFDCSHVPVEIPERELDWESLSEELCWRVRMTEKEGVCYNSHAGHGQMLRVVGLARELNGMHFLTVSCR